MRCWGSSSRAETKGLEYQRSDCRMDSAVFVSGRLQTGRLTARHESTTEPNSVHCDLRAFIRRIFVTSSSAVAHPPLHHTARKAWSIAKACRCAPLCAYRHIAS